MKNLLFSKSWFALVLVVFPLMMLWQPSVATESAESEALPLEDLRLFAEIFNMIKSDYVESVDDATL
ncbi:MAG: peptidase S41, partial [Proteobacteria bacterium]|nr:peptidase S41 [Pseudomonadota bacterium]